MPSTRRVKLVAILLAIVICTILYLSVSIALSLVLLALILIQPIQNDSSSQDFYSRTVAALDKKQASDAEVERKLQEVKEAAKAQEPAAGNAPQKPLVESATKDASHVDGGVPKKEEDKTTSEKEEESEKSVAGRKTMKGEESKDLQSGQEAPTDIGKDKEKNESKDVGKKENAKEDTAKSKENHEIEVELNLILKKGPSTSGHSLVCALQARLPKLIPGVTKSSFSPKPTAHTPPKLSGSSSKNTQLCQLPTWSSLINIPSAAAYNLRWKRAPDGEQCRTC